MRSRSNNAAKATNEGLFIEKSRKKALSDELIVSTERRFI